MLRKQESEWVRERQGEKQEREGRDRERER